MSSLDDETSRFLNAWMSVRQMVQAANFNRFQRAGLSATQFMTLNVVPEEGITLSELARSLNLSPASLKKTVDSLEQRGLLLRKTHAEDTRKINIVSTKAGTRLKNTASGEFHRFISGLFQAIPRDERRGLIAGLERLIQVSGRDGLETAEPTSRAGGVVRAGRNARRAAAR